MIVATRSGGQRLYLQLDPRMAFEALILQRLARIPTGRRQEWLRGLLVQGFLDECRLRREADGKACWARPKKISIAGRIPGYPRLHSVVPRSPESPASELDVADGNAAR